jgi:hypothetical protein
MPEQHRPIGPPAARTYQIRVRGPVGPTILEAFPTLAAHRLGGDTVLSGSLADQSALYGVVHLLESLGLELLEVRQIAARGPAQSGGVHSPGSPER